MARLLREKAALQVILLLLHSVWTWVTGPCCSLHHQVTVDRLRTQTLNEQVWFVTCGVWLVACDVWQLTFDVKYASCQTHASLFARWLAQSSQTWVAAEKWQQRQRPPAKMNHCRAIINQWTPTDIRNVSFEIKINKDKALCGNAVEGYLHSDAKWPLFFVFFLFYFYLFYLTRDTVAKRKMRIRGGKGCDGDSLIITTLI